MLNLILAVGLLETELDLTNIINDLLTFITEGFLLESETLVVSYLRDFSQPGNPNDVSGLQLSHKVNIYK